MPRLFLNHADAWGLTLVICALPLLIHQVRLTPLSLALIVTVTVCYWLGFAVNDYFDAPFDAQHHDKRRRNFFARQTVGKGWLRLGLLAAFGSAVIVLAQFGLKGALVALFGGLALWLYSAPPARLKTRPGWDLLMHVLFVQTFPYAVVMYLLVLPWQAIDTVLLTTFGLASLTAQLEQQIRDYEVDSRTERNFTTVVGIRWSSRLLRFGTILLIANVTLHTLAAVIPLALAPFGIIALPILLHRFLRSSSAPRSEWLVRLSVAAALLYAVIAAYSTLPTVFVNTAR
ncbi:MAG: UbiA family prenyltransferase [Anaerolineae bacterium]|nr:UbiA family prenyltransferase [Anaerolineae bacterium]